MSQTYKQQNNPRNDGHEERTCIKDQRSKCASGQYNNEPAHQKHENKYTKKSNKNGNNGFSRIPNNRIEQQ